MESRVRQPTTLPCGTIATFPVATPALRKAGSTRRPRPASALDIRVLVDALTNAFEWYVKELGFAPLLNIMGNTPAAALWHLVTHETDGHFPPATLSSTRTKHPAALSPGVVIAIQALTRTREKHMT